MNATSIAERSIKINGLAGLSMRGPDEPPSVTRNREAVSQQTLEAFARLEPATDEEAGAVVPLSLRLTEVEVDSISAHSRAYAAAVERAREAEQNHTEAEICAKRITMLKGQLLDAQARGNAVEDLRRQLDRAESAADQVPVLKRRLDAALQARNAAFGALRVCVNESIAALRTRAATRVCTATAELSQALAALDAAIAVQPLVQAELANGWSMQVLGNLQVPSPTGLGFKVPQVEARHAELEYSRPMLLSALHPRFTAQCTAARGHIEQQVALALVSCGLAPSRVL